MNNEASKEKLTTEGTAKTIYILYLVGIVVVLPGIIGLIMAYVNKGDSPDWLKSHYQFQIRTFWMGLIYLLIGSWILVAHIGGLSAFGVPILLFWLVWLIVRCAKGMKFLNQKEAYPNPTGRMF